MKNICLIILMTFASLLPSIPQEPRDIDKLGMALDYFNSAKYHEALLILEKLDKEYQLNPRFRAYMGVCYYYEWLYEEACKYLDEAIPHLDVFAPHERSVYYFTNAESHFQLQQYANAIPYYEKALTVCFENEKGDIYYRLGFCYMFAEQWMKAYENFKNALDNYLQFRNNVDMNARITQTAHMMKGCEEHLKKTNQWVPEIIVPDTVSIITDTTTIDTISTRLPEGVNIDEIFQQKTEIKE